MYSATYHRQLGLYTSSLERKGSLKNLENVRSQQAPAAWLRESDPRKRNDLWRLAKKGTPSLKAQTQLDRMETGLEVTR